MHVTVSSVKWVFAVNWVVMGANMTTIDYAHRSPRTAERYETSDGLVAVALLSVGGFALTLLAIWLGWGGEFLSFG
jgi:hypothetical protein